MIGLILLYFVGKAFYDLAGEHNKSQWGFAILGVVSYYVGLFIGAFIIGIVAAAMDVSVEGVNEILLSLMAIPVGVLSCWGLYQILKSQWSKEPVQTHSEDILDANLIDNEPNPRDPQ